MPDLNDLQEQLAEVKTQVAVQENEVKRLEKDAKTLGIKSMDNLDDLKKKLVKEVESLEKKQTKLLEQAENYLEEHEI